MPEATLVVLNAHVVTLNPKQPTAEAIAINANKIIAVGSNRQIHKHAGRTTKIVDAKGNTVVPGLNDCHVHMASLGRLLQNLDVTDAHSIVELQARLRIYAEENSERNWILEGRWDQEKFAEKRYPTRHDLDAAVSDRPVFLIRVCGHIGVANSKALEMAAITSETTVQGGKVYLDDTTGEPNGLLGENALELVWKAIPRPDPLELEQELILACKKAVEAGLTCVHWMVRSPRDVSIVHRLCSTNRLPLRVCLGIPIRSLDFLIGLGLETGFGSDMVKIGFIKILADGSLGARTAALEEPYSDGHDTCGMMLYEEKELDELVLKSHKAGLQLAIHAIGDHAVLVVLNAFEKALKQHPSKNHRHRVEHASVLNLQLIRRMKKLGLIVSVQPHFVASDFWVVDRVGTSRARWAYPFKTLMHEGLWIASGSDCPVEPISPIRGIWASVARKSFPQESLTIQEALKTYTSNAAYASFDEDKRGTIEAGKLADLTILSGDLFNVARDDIKLITAEMTIVDGRIVYAKNHAIEER
jgi:predicted amidohydrolase YtcJ